MPYFVWDGVRLDGTTTQGKIRVRSYDDLEYFLLQQDIGLVSYKIYSSRSWFRPIRLHTIQALIYKLSLLIKAGVPFDETLEIAKNQCNHSELQSILKDVTYDIHEGSSLSESLQYYHCFSPVMIHMIQAGQESGDMGKSLQRLSIYLEKRSSFFKRLKQVAFVPLVTFVFFVAIALIILVYIVPAFATMFLASQKSIPQSTRIVLAISSLVQGMGLVILAGFCAGIVMLYKKVSKFPQFQRFHSYVALRLPLCGHFIKTINSMMFLETFGLMIDGGVDIRQAFSCSIDAMKNKELQNRLMQAQQELERGKSLSASLQHHADSIFTYDVCAMIEVGEESGTLPEVLHSVVADQHEQLQHVLMQITTMVQPALMIVLGLLIAALIFAVYIPIFDLSHVMS